MIGERPALFRGRHFADDVIVLCVRWYLRYSLSYRDLAEMMVERQLSVDPSTIWRWVQRYAPELNARIRRELKPTNGSWRTDETYVRVAGRCTYLYRAWTRPVQPSTSFFRRLAMCLPLARSSARRWLRQAILARGKSMWTGTPRIPVLLRN